MLDQMCHCYAAGDRDARDPRYFESVQWREFALDVNRIQPQPYLEGLQGMVHTYPQIGVLGEDDPDVFSPISPISYNTGGYGPVGGQSVGFNVPPQEARRTFVQRATSAGGRAAVAAGAAGGMAAGGIGGRLQDGQTHMHTHTHTHTHTHHARTHTHICRLQDGHRADGALDIQVGLRRRCMITGGGHGP